MILIDTGGVLATLDGDDPNHASVRRVLAEPQERLLSPFVLGELDYMVNRFAGQAASLRLIADVVRGAYRLEPFGVEDLVRAQAIIERYRDLGIGLTDASIVVLAERYDCHDVLTLDQRHFRTITTLDGQPFRLLPLDDSSG